MMIYKYYRPNQTYFFDNLMVRFTQPDALNDPFDCLPRIKDNNLEITRHMKREKFNKRLMSCPPSEQIRVKKSWDKECEKASKKHPRLNRLHASHQVKRNISDRFGVFSASKCFDNILMWSHYAQNHSGFVVAMDTSHDFFKGGDGIPKNLSRTKNVSYKYKRASVRFSTNSLDPKIMLIKSRNWMYEKEVRLIRPLELADKVETKDDNEWPIYLFSVPPECIRFVIFGFKTSLSMCDEIQNMVKNKPRLRHVQFYGAEPDPRTYLIHKKQYNRVAC